MQLIAKKVLRKIKEHGYEAYFVGGYPRNLFLGMAITDIDICTNAKIEDIKRIFFKERFQEKYGSCSLCFNNVKIEITTFRKELQYNKKGQPIKMKFVDSLEVDLKRRDFTINTLCMDENENYLDVLGALKDLENRLIKMVGHPKKRLKDDPNRLLRALRLVVVLDFTLDETLKYYIKNYGYLLNNLSYEKKKIELDKMFASENKLMGFNLIMSLNLEESLNIILSDVKLTTKGIGIWAQLDVVDVYPFSKKELKEIKLIKELLKKDVLDYKNLYTYGIDISFIVSEINGIDTSLVVEHYNKLPIKNRQDIKITAKEICDVLNIQPGVIVGDIINDLENKIIRGLLLNESASLKQYILNYKS